METNFLVYDDQCSFCTSLAGMAKRISTAQKINITKWTDFKQSELAKRLLSEIEIKAVLPDALLLVTGMEIHRGPEAWKWLLANHPSLNSLNWLANKLNLHAATASTLSMVTATAKRSCLWCRPW